jgi:Bifunctional DNA primase/polymerase, N-terminal
MTPMSPMQQALQLAEDGFAAFPCRTNKRPACPHGFYDASSDPSAIVALWREYPGHLVGVRTGAASDLAVLDIDAKHAEASTWWAEHRNDLLPTHVVRSRSGGLHLWYRHAPGLRCSAGMIATGVDVRADGGYIIAWQAVGFKVLCGAALAPWPMWLPAQPKAIQRGSEPTRVPDDRRVAALVRVAALAPETRRNAKLFWAACRMSGMVSSGLLPKAEAEELLVRAAMHAGLPELEARRTARSGFAAGGAG